MTSGYKCDNCNQWFEGLVKYCYSVMITERMGSSCGWDTTFGQEMDLCETCYNNKSINIPKWVGAKVRDD